MTDPYIGGFVSPYGQPYNEDSDTGEDAFLELEAADVETEANRQDSSESGHIAMPHYEGSDWWAQQEKFGAPLTPEEQKQVNEIHADLKRNAQKKHAVKTPADAIHDSVDASEREKSFIEKETNAIMARVTTPNAGEAMKHFVKASQKAAEATKQFAEAVDKAGKQFAKTMKALKPKYVPEPHLTYRPFHTPEMVEFRKNLLLR